MSHHPIYLFAGQSGLVLAARRMEKGERYGSSSEHEASEAGVLFYQVERGSVTGEEIAPGHLRGRRLSPLLPYADFMQHRGSLALSGPMPRLTVQSRDVAETQSYFRRVGGAT